MNRQKMFLFVLLILFAITVVYSYFRLPRQQTVTTSKLAPSAPVVAGKAKQYDADDVTLHLSLLDGQAARSAGSSRNIFWLMPLHTQKKLPPPPPPPPPVYRPPVMQTPLPPPPPPAPPLAKFTFLGFLKKDNKRTIFLTKDNEIILAKKGDTLAGKYEVINISEEALTINSIGGGGQIVIPLIENMPLKTAGE